MQITHAASPAHAFLLCCAGWLAAGWAAQDLWRVAVAAFESVAEALELYSASSPTAAEIIRLRLGRRRRGINNSSRSAFAWRSGGRERAAEEGGGSDGEGAFADDEGSGTVVVSRARLSALTALASSIDGVSGVMGGRNGGNRQNPQQQRRRQQQQLLHYGSSLLEPARCSPSPSPNSKKKSRNAAAAAAASKPSCSSSPSPAPAASTTSMINADALARRHSVAGERVFLTASALVRLPPASSPERRQNASRFGGGAGGQPSAPFAPAAAATAAATASPLCRVCWDSPVSVALLPCGHVGTCLSCTIRLLTAKGAALADAENDAEFALDDEDEDDDDAASSSSDEDDDDGRGRERGHRRQQQRQQQQLPLNSDRRRPSPSLLAANSSSLASSSRETAAESVGRAVAGGVPCPFCGQAVADFARVYIV